MIGLAASAVATREATTDSLADREEDVWSIFLGNGTCPKECDRVVVMFSENVTCFIFGMFCIMFAEAIEGLWERERESERSREEIMMDGGGSVVDIEESQRKSEQEVQCMFGEVLT